jgi:hypothetical protein
LCIIDLQATALDDADDAMPHAEDEDLLYDAEDEVVFPETPVDDEVPGSLLPCCPQLVQEQLLEAEFTPLPPEWDGLNYNVVLRCLKSMNADSLQVYRLRDFYKSVSSWSS